MLAEWFTAVAAVGAGGAGFAGLEPGGHIDRFFVHADRRGRGVARAVLSAILAESGRVGLGRPFAEAGTTARPFLARHRLVVLADQQAVVRGVALTNFRGSVCSEAGDGTPRAIMPPGPGRGG
jgi:putative acetyltransferase